MNSQKGFANIVLVIALVVIVVGAGAYFLMTKKPSAPSTNSTTEFPTTQQNTNVGTQPTQTNTPPKTTPAQPASTWQTYRSSYGFEIQYPQGWKIVNELDSKKVSYPTTILLSVSFGTGTYGNEGYDGEWFVFVRDKSSASVEGLIKDMGKQFSDRQEKRENITINGVSALKVIVTTPSTPSWVYEAVIVEKGNSIYFVHNGAIKNDLFDKFYSSFKLN